jgi:hypothetical protein
MPRPKETAPPLARPGRWKRNTSGGPRPLVDSVYLGDACRREVEVVARAYKVSLSEVVRVLVMAHAGELDVAYEEHRLMAEKGA